MFTNAQLAAALAAAASSNPDLISQITQLMGANGQQQSTPQQSSMPQQQQQQQQQSQQPQQSTSQNNSIAPNELQQLSPQNLSFKRRGRRPKHPHAMVTTNQPSTSQVVIGGNSTVNSRSSNSSLDPNLSQRMQAQVRINQQRQQQHQSQQQTQPVINQDNFTLRIQQHLQQIVQQQQQSQRNQIQMAANEPSLNSNQMSGMNPGTSGLMETQKRKRGRPPLSGPSTSAGMSSNSSGNFNYLDVMLAMRNQQQQRDNQRENRMQIDRQRDMRLQQERDSQRELQIQQERESRLQQDRERQRQLELEREKQRKHQHKMAIIDIDRERRRQHMIMVKNLDAYKRNEEREKAMVAMMAERKAQLERRIHQKRLEVELQKEIRKPVDDMILMNQKPLATLNRIPGLKLPGKAFANLLMFFEFLYNFGDTVGMEIKSIPDINTLQLGLLNIDNWSEDKLVDALHHLVMFAIKDPRFPYAGSLKEVENIESTNEGLSQLLHFYLEVKMQAKFDSDHEVRLFNLTKQNYFLSLNATQKAEMLAYVCNELLCSQNITKHMEDTIENVAKLRKDKWVLENEIRKYRVIKTKRELREEAEQRALDEQEKADEASVSDDKSNLVNGSSSQDENKEQESTTNLNQATISVQPDDELEPEMANEELNKKIDNLVKQYSKTSNKLDRAISSMRVTPLGQDRYRRRYWVLPQVGGVFVEGMESSEPDELENNKFTDEELNEYDAEQEALKELEKLKEEEQNLAEEKQNESSTNGIKTEKNEVEEVQMDVKEEGSDIKEDEDIELTKQEESPTCTDFKEEGSLVKEENGVDNEEEIVEDDRLATQAPRIPWFSILPRVLCNFDEKQEGDNNNDIVGDEDKKVDEEDKELSADDLLAMKHEICPALAKRLEELEAEQYPTPKKIHPQFQCGWWRITDSQQLKAILAVLHERGTRERTLQKHLAKHFQMACNSCKNTTVDFQITAYDRQLAGKNYGAPLPHTDDDSAEDLNDGDGEEQVDEEEDEDEEQVEEQPANPPPPKKKKKKASRSSLRSRRQRARNAARSRRQPTK